MDELYDNLENYYDEKIIDELKSENKELKSKLEEYSSALTRLQKDFDKLNSEYKKLEMNYSSVLKTARAEIERKSEMIKSLNIEKDLLIIKTMQTSGKNILKTIRHNSYDTQRSKKSHEIDIKCAVKPQPGLQSGNQNEEKRQRSDRINSTHTQSEDNISSLENNSNFSEDKELRDTNNDFRNKTDKLMKDVHMKSKGGKISNRRKSMSLYSNVEPIFSSNDDFEALNLKNIRKSPLREDVRHSDKYRSRDSCKDRFYKNKTNRFIAHGKYKHDRYESGSKWTRHSPEKCRSKCTAINNHHSETHKSRADFKISRQRVLKSPATDKYNRSKSRDRKTFEIENNYDKQQHSLHNYDTSAVKHKMRNELDEPSRKRQKTEQNKNGSKEENFSNSVREIEHDARNSFTKQEEFEPSCQSPDYVNIENTIPQHVVKEIKHTAATPLEDPRISSKKYAIKSNKDKTILSTVTSPDIDLKPINVSSWEIPNIKKFMIPPTLPAKRLPEETKNDYVNEIYMDIDNIPLLNDSMESGEIQSLTDYDNCYTKNCGMDNMYENKKIIEDSKTLNSLTVIDSNKTKNPVSNKYKIPKIKQPDKISTSVEHEDFGLLSMKRNSASNYSNENKECEIEKCGEVSSSRLNPDIENSTNDEQYKHSQMNTVLPEKTLAAVGCTLADDLELSDEASESRDIRNYAKKSKKILPKCKPPIDSVDSNKQKKHDMPLVHDENINNELKEKSKPMRLKKAPKDSCRDSVKTRKNKKKTELKDASCTEAKEQNKKLQKISKPAISIQTKHKFNDLFGDSSSLITPDDLGILPSDIQLPLTDKCVSIFDNTQDAVDLCVADINRAQSNASESNTFPFIRKAQSNDETIIEKAGNDSEKPLVSKDFDKNTTAGNLPENNLCEKATINDESNTFPVIREDQSNDKTIIEKMENDSEKPLVSKDLNKNTTASNLPEINLCEKATINDESHTFPFIIKDQSNDETIIEKTGNDSEKPLISKDFNKNTTASNLPEINLCEKATINDESHTFSFIRKDQSNDETIIEKTGNDSEKPLISKDFNKNTTASNLSEINLCKKATINEVSEIVKTVIISTGVQPKYSSESNSMRHNQESDVEHTGEIIRDKSNINSNMKTCILNNIKALATSTPQKTDHVDISTAIPDPILNDASKITENTNLSSNVSNASNPDEILKEADAPDVRLFVKRRRKIIKKPS